MKRSYIRYIGSVLLSILLVGFFWQYIDWTMISDLFSNIHWGWCLATLTLYLVYQMARSIRLSKTFKTPMPLIKGTAMMSVQSLVNATLPLALGEAFLVWILGKKHKIKWTEATGSVLTLRLADLAIYALFFLGVLVFAQAALPDHLAPTIFMVFFGVCAVGLLCLCVIIWARKSQKEYKWLNPIINIEQQVKSILKPKRLIPVLSLTLFMWGIMFAIKATSLYALGLSLPLTTLLWIYIVPIELLPIKGIANIGSYEISWFLVLQALGYSATQASVFAFGSHILILSLRFSAAAIGAMILTYGYKK